MSVHKADDVVDLMFAHLRTTSPDGVEALRADPVGAVEAWPGIRVLIAAGATTESTDLAGSYQPEPPTIQLSETAGPGRLAFTALHELGHHLQHQSIEVADVLASAGAPEAIEELEEAACNRFAARVLFGDDPTQDLFHSGVTVKAISDVATSGRASLAACCVEATRHIQGPGQVMILDAAGVVEFRASAGIPTVKVGTDQTPSDPIGRAIANNTLANGVGGLNYRDGIVGADQFIQCGPVGHRYVAVVVSEHPAWTSGFVTPIADRQLTAPEWDCPHCDESFASYDTKCERCDQPECTQCGRCACTTQSAERLCQSCFLMQPVSAFEGASAICRDCS